VVPQPKPVQQPKLPPKPAPKPVTPPKPPAQTQADVDKLNAQRDAATILQNVFAQYGLGSLAGQITGFIQQGYSADAISILLQNTPEYKQRFAANDARLKKGLPALSPAEYIATERSYRQVMSAAGLPLGFYDQTSDFQKFLENDMSSDRTEAARGHRRSGGEPGTLGSQGLLPAVVQHGRHDCLCARPH
jgi:hypothetical protein